ncbi:unnamed protein product [marine sediment metagenome]|uniref:Uncharacterized protein n=1 Tax=marine sediment metagenome TaxID=412755 RepID=X1L0S4_9ZZZZ
MKKIAIYDRYLSTVGGGERYSCKIAEVLSKQKWPTTSKNHKQPISNHMIGKIIRPFFAGPTVKMSYNRFRSKEILPTS